MSGEASSSNVASTVMPSMPFSLRTSPRRVPDEGDVEERDALEHLVGADGVEGREPGKQRDGDLEVVGHAEVLSVVGSGAALKRRR